MGATYVTTTVKELSAKKKGYSAEFLVDTGATDCLVAGSKLRKAGVKVEGKKVYTLADGRSQEFEYGFARVSFFGSETVAQVIFGPEDADPILGVVALENTGIAVDPKNQTLRRLPAMLLK